MLAVVGSCSWKAATSEGAVKAERSVRERLPLRCDAMRCDARRPCRPRLPVSWAFLCLSFDADDLTRGLQLASFGVSQHLGGLLAVPTRRPSMPWAGKLGAGGDVRLAGFPFAPSFAGPSRLWLAAMPHG